MNLSEQKIVARQHGAMEFTNPPVDLDSVRRYRLDRIHEQLRKHDYAGILLFDQINCRYASDATNMQLWCSHYETRCVFVATDGPLILFDYGDYPHLAEDIPTIDEYRVHSSFYYFSAGGRSSEKAEQFADTIADLVIKYGGGNRRLAIDRLSHVGCEPLLRRKIEIQDGLKVMELARAIKSDQELVLMQEAISVCEQGIRSMRESLEPGITENALWAKLHETNISLGGEWIETRLLSSGPRTFPWFRESSMRVIELGDMVSFDTDLIGPYGYCADMSRSWVCGDKPSDEQRRIYAYAYQQIQHNVAMLMPGMTFEEASRAAWTIPREFASNKYSSLIHGIGLADEYPGIKHRDKLATHGYEGTIEENMTLCVESYIGSERSGEGVKLEEQVVITSDGARLMTLYPFEMEWL
ncbi:MAG: Xaa-Pro peptidase family protein [Gammaproteobacteria bacterium]|nr:Xaa-Pro peptidase family protein [Gammaproteobacteria bacterium]MCY4227990.1 Xaa-Pro peptidase family protein [Gammaproteobacteria bacterium]MCY4313583.1 Xaa-Pro peptidase family protein [Gammaproteobacteria bacterium]